MDIEVKMKKRSVSFQTQQHEILLNTNFALVIA